MTDKSVFWKSEAQAYLKAQVFPNPLMAAASCLSDVQEMMYRAQYAKAVEYINVAKTILFNEMETK